MRQVNCRDGTKLCQRCQNEKNNNKKHADFVHMFSRENDMHYGEIPNCMKDLTNIEKAAIKRLLNFKVFK